MFLVCYSLLNSQNISKITVRKGWLLGHLWHTKKAAEVAQKKEQQLAHGESYPQWKWDDKMDGVGIASKPKGQNPK